MTPNLLSDPAPLRLIDMSASDVLGGMILAFFLCSVLARTFVFNSSCGATPQNLPKSMVLLGVTVSLIMAVIGNSLARAFGAIGALSLVRFRTAIKDPRDLSHLFMSISVGMACGSGYFKIAIGATGLLCLFSLLIERFPLTEPQKKMCLMKIRYSTSPETATNILSLLRKRAFLVKVLAQESLEQGQIVEMVIEIGLSSKESIDDLFSKLSEISPTIKTNLLLS